ncbi:dTDP-4-dehydrorhamnose reductase [Tenacibaculum sp. MAR_2009_124]|uniref:SDR family oxidoreductase n=1 Tax=Tenacibaculum sp. MAR_2009_124 TaxID=1250059 RepID=UPI000899A404|nr:SDR family oxidoreductase [Tenacibaculum sp. MAR_2009_124]SEB73530.1 dTDP-4-dehydrorhamnose reductase [Tenacibaculum sp. MAR_2009_124]
MKKVIVTGSNGLLGQSLLALLLDEKDAYEVVGFSRGKNRSGRDDFQYVSIDLTDKKKLIKELNEIKPDVIINTAAMTQVDQCEEKKDECHILNVEVVESLIEFSNDNDVHIIHLSTDFIFDGKKGYYKETDIPNPVSYYGLSKLKAEDKLINSGVDHTILRTILVYGKVFDMSRSNIVLWVKESLEAGNLINVVNDQYRMPTYVKTLSEACKLAIDKRKYGIYNISSTELLSVYDIAIQIAEAFNLNKGLISPIASKELNQRAQRPEKTGFDLNKTKKELGIELRKFKEDLQNFKQIIT